MHILGWRALTAVRDVLLSSGDKETYFFSPQSYVLLQEGLSATRFQEKSNFFFIYFLQKESKSPHYQTLNNDLNFFLTVMPHFKEKLRVWLGSLPSTLLKLGHTYLYPRKLLWWAKCWNHTETLHALKAAEETGNYLQVVSTNMSHQNKDMFNAWVLTMANSIR